ncbi:ATP-dependent RecD-like DNA helicase-like protein [Virus Rctr197k]|nr:ATP-dependent RecD-like DNA helicase-like protein [Virus Rctr197k]
MGWTSVAAELGLSLAQVQTGLALLEQPRIIRRRGEEIQKDPQIVRDGNRVALADLFRAEQDIAKHIRRLQGAELPELVVPDGAFANIAPHKPDASQRAAVEVACRSNVVVMTGGPGVGKTTVARAIIAAYQAGNLDTKCCAPTGKAAIRMRQQTGVNAATVHTTLGLIPGQAPRFTETNPLQTRAVVLDEASMVDTRLMAELLRAIPTGARLLIIGDVDQLPSIGAGRVLFDIITSQAVATVRLTEIHRQANASCVTHGDACPGPSCPDHKPGSRIPYVARDINHGRLPAPLTKVGSDFTHWETPVAEEAAARIVGSLTDPTASITVRKGIPVTDIQVIAAQYKGPCGVVALNTALQETLNPPPNNDHNGDIFIGRGYSTRLRDRVIHNRNDRNLLVMNGEIGYVVACDPEGLDVNAHLDAMWSGKIKKEKDGSASESDWDGDDDDQGYDSDDEGARDELEELVRTYGGLQIVDDDGERRVAWSIPRVLLVDFGDRRVAYSKSEAHELELAYVITVHRSQGSQFPAVVMVLHALNAFMLTRPLVYTAITRAERFCLTVGTGDQLGRAARNTRGTERRTLLQDRLAKTPLQSGSTSSLGDLTLV